MIRRVSRDFSKSLHVLINLSLYNCKFQTLFSPLKQPFYRIRLKLPEVVVYGRVNKSIDSSVRKFYDGVLMNDEQIKICRKVNVIVIHNKSHVKQTCFIVFLLFSVSWRRGMFEGWRRIGWVRIILIDPVRIAFYILIRYHQQKYGLDKILRLYLMEMCRYQIGAGPILSLEEHQNMCYTSWRQCVR